jgi:hypothetical protein
VRAAHLQGVGERRPGPHHDERPGQAHAQTLVLVMGSMSRPAVISSEPFFRLIVPSLRTLFDVASPGRRLAFLHTDTLPHARR